MRLSISARSTNLAMGSPFQLNNLVPNDNINNINFDVSITLLNDGLLTVRLDKVGNGGNFRFLGSQLTVNANRVTPVGAPEPTTLGLIGLGLLGLGAMKRRRRYS